MYSEHMITSMALIGFSVEFEITIKPRVAHKPLARRVPGYLPMDHDKQIPGCLNISPFKFLSSKVNSPSVRRRNSSKSPSVEMARVSVLYAHSSLCIDR